MWRKIQQDFNLKNRITPKTVYKSLDEILDSTSVAGSNDVNTESIKLEYDLKDMLNEDKKNILIELKKAMHGAAENLKFEKAANIRDEIKKIEKELPTTINDR